MRAIGGPVEGQLDGHAKRAGCVDRHGDIRATIELDLERFDAGEVVDDLTLDRHVCRGYGVGGSLNIDVGSAGIGNVGKRLQDKRRDVPARRQADLIVKLVVNTAQDAALASRLGRLLKARKGPRRNVGRSVVAVKPVAAAKNDSRMI